MAKLISYIQSTLKYRANNVIIFLRQERHEILIENRKFSSSDLQFMMYLLEVNLSHV